MRKWSIDDSAELYNINGWGLNYFSINEKGHVAVTPRGSGVSIDLKELMEELQVRDVEAPVLLRFPDILDNRIEKISNCFEFAAREYGYTAKNFIIYPIKVNQMRPVVEEIVSHGNKFNIGLEAGSKPELHAVLSIDIDDDAMIICNGYKDESYIEFVEDRLGHDKRYAISNDKITSELNWKPSLTFEEGIKLTINWYLNNQDWINSIERKKASYAL